MTPGWAADREDLERTFETMVEQIRQKDAEGVVSHFHADAVVFLRDRLFPLDFGEIGKKALDDLMTSFLAEVIAADLRPIDVSYRVFDGVGLVWGLSEFHVDPRSGSGSSFQSRISVVFVEDGDDWKIIHWHSSAIPSREARAVSP